MRDNMKELLDKQPKANYGIINRYLLMMLHLEGMLNNSYQEFNEIVKGANIYKQDIKSNLLMIQRKLKVNIKNDWRNADIEKCIQFGDDAEEFEKMIKHFFEIDAKFSLLLTTKFRIGDIVWADHNGKTVLCKVKSIHINAIVSDAVTDNTSFILSVLREKSMVETGIEIEEKEMNIYKSKKEIQSKLNQSMKKMVIRRNKYDTKRTDRTDKKFA